MLTLEESAVGYIIRDEEVLIGDNYKNTLTAIVSEGERAAKGQTIFRYGSNDEDDIKTKIDELNLKIQEALEKEPKVLPTDVKNLEKQIDEKLQDIKDLTDIHTITEYKKEIENVMSKKAKIVSKSGAYLQDLNNQKEELEKKLTENSEYIKATKAGVVSYRVDGLESVLTVSDFNDLTEEKLENLDLKTGKIISASNEKGKVIDNFQCYLCSVLDSEPAKNAEIGDKVLITLSSSNEITAEIKYIAKQENGKVLMVFDLKTLTQELTDYRKISFNITWWTYQGLKVPNSSILEDEQKNKYVVRKKQGESQKILVKLLKKNDKYSIISAFNQEELQTLGIDAKKYKKISQYDNILLYPSK